MRTHDRSGSWQEYVGQIFLKVPLEYHIHVRRDFISRWVDLHKRHSSGEAVLASLMRESWLPAQHRLFVVLFEEKSHGKTPCVSEVSKAYA